MTLRYTFMAKTKFTTLDNLSLQGIDQDAELIPLLTPEDEEAIDNEELPEVLPILPLRNTVLFPGVVIPITAGRDKAIKLINEANQGNKTIGVVSQKEEGVENPKLNDINTVGVVARILRVLKMPDGNTTVILQGKKRFKINELVEEKPYIKATVLEVAEARPASANKEFTAIIESIKDLALEIIKESPNIPTEASFAIKNIESNSFLINFVSSNLNLPVEEKQRLLEINDLKERALATLKFMNLEFQKLELKNDIQSKVQNDMSQQQREYFLHQQMKTIQEELGGVSHEDELEEMRMKSKSKKWDEKVQKHFDKELSKMQRMNPQVAEYSRNDMKSPILCLYGPPGVGKTSLGKSIAEALGREYVRISLGGLRDEAEIRGHRKTYIGAMPGRIIQSLKKAGTSNPVFVLDEIDKLSVGSQGDPSSALLEVLDPEQNSEFYDNFLEMGFDLSKVMFIATSNSLATIQPALRDRMEIINVTGYTIEEKVEIAKIHLLPKQLKEHGLESKHLKIDKKHLEKIVEGYTRESGVRGLEKQIAKMVRYAAKSIAMEEEYRIKVTKDDIIEVLGVPRLERDKYENNDVAGVVTGLAWTSVGGDILFIESILSKGKGILNITGNLGKVMKESATIAMEYIKANAIELEINPDIFEKYNVHIHVPEGATPKDGPSAGITMLTSLVSLFTQRKVKKSIAMTGEITLRGKVLPVGGIKEKILAAKRAHIKEILLCADNKRDIEEIKPEYLKGLTFHYVKDMDEVLDLAITKTKVKKAKKL